MACFIEVRLNSFRANVAHRSWLRYYDANSVLAHVFAKEAALESWSRWRRRSDPGQADALMTRASVSFCDGYDTQVVPSRFVHVKQCDRPMARSRSLRPYLVMRAPGRRSNLQRAAAPGQRCQARLLETFNKEIVSTPANLTQILQDRRGSLPGKCQPIRHCPPR